MTDFFPGFDDEMIDVGGGVRIRARRAGRGVPLLLLHGHPETHVMWHKVAPELADRYTVVVPDLRGYGDSSHPVGLPDHSNYSRKAMGADMDAVMRHFGFDEYFLAGHDRGARVAHRMLLEYPTRIRKCVLLDIVPTFDAYRLADRKFGEGYWHWFGLIQENGLPERLIAGNYEAFVRSFLAPNETEEERRRIFPDAVSAEYVQKLGTPEGFHSICEDYRACATIDLAHDAEDRDKLAQMPVLVLWGEKNYLGKFYDVVGLWRDRCADVRGRAVPDCGHYIPEDRPEYALEAMREFLG